MGTSKSFLDKLCERDINLSIEISKVYKIINSNNTLNSDLYFAFKKSKLAFSFADFGQMYNELISRTNTIDGFLDFCEVFNHLWNVYDYSYCKTDMKQILAILNFDAKKLGYELIEKNGFPKYKLIDAETEVVSSSLSKNLQDKITDYLTIRNGDINAKRLCLKAIADDFDLIKNKLVYVKEFKKLSQLEQCIRHPKEEKMREFPFFFEKEEEWMDKLFKLFISAFAYNNSKEICAEFLKNENE